jgi:S-formylglutathione hydrolase FrmB
VTGLVRDPASLPPLWIDCGRSDPLLPANRDLHERLVGAGVGHHYDEFDGEHDWAAWSVRVEHGLSFFDDVLTTREAGGGEGLRSVPGGRR